MKSKILEIIKEKHRTSGGHCGTYAPEIMKKLKCQYKDIKGVLNQLYIEKTIIIRPGIKGQLIFYNNGNNRKNKSN